MAVRGPAQGFASVRPRQDLCDEEKQRPRSFSGATTVRGAASRGVPLHGSDLHGLLGREVSATGSERSSGILTPRFLATMPRPAPLPGNGFGHE